MLRCVVLLNLILCSSVISKRRQHKDSGEVSEGGDLGSNLVTALRNDVNVDLPMDEEYEDLRAELLAYHTALATLTSGRRSMKTTPCWQLGGVCIGREMCEGHRYLSEVPGCKSKLQVCCFTWNNYQVRDMKDKGLSAMVMPWSQKLEIGGKGVLDPEENSGETKKKKYKATPHPNPAHDYNSDEEIHDQGDHAEIPHLDKDYQRQFHENINHQDHYNKNSDYEKSPVLVILRKKKKK